jgi:hypothetical protein
MNLQEVSKTYDFTGKTIAITGGGGVLCSGTAKSKAPIAKR